MIRKKKEAFEDRVLGGKMKAEWWRGEGGGMMVCEEGEESGR